MTELNKLESTTNTTLKQSLNFRELMQALNPGVAAQVTISTDTLTEAFADFLDKYYYWQNRTIQLDNVEMAIDEANRTLSFSGKSSFLNVPNMPVTAVFSIDETGQVHATLKYSLISEQQTASYWFFSQSFPDLPIEFDYSSASHVNDLSALDLLSFYHAHVIVSMHPQRERQYEVELEEGINFAGSMNPLGALGILDNILPQTTELTLFGVIRIPKDYTQVFLPKAVQDLTAARVYPWEVASELPGIHLQARLDTEFGIGKAQFKDAVFRIYSPLSREWVAKDEVYHPIKAFTATLDIPDSGVAIDAIARIEKGLDNIAVETRCEGVSLQNMARLTDLTGSESLTAQLPESMMEAVNGLNKLELMDLAFTIAWGKQGIYPLYATLQVGMPDLNWQVWGDHLVVDGIGCRFSVSNPLQKPHFEVDLWGKTAIEGIPITIKASKSEGFMLMAKLEEQQTIPLKQLMQRYAPQIPPPANLTVNNLFVAIAPKQFYMMNCALAEKPASWGFKIGPTQLKFSNLRMDLNIPYQGQTTGSIRGEIALGNKLSLDAAYSMPGQVVIQSEVKQISLKQLAQKFSDTPLTLPAGFDLTLKNASILIKKEQTGYLFQTATTIDKLGIVAFEARKVSGQKFGVAAGLSLTARPSQLPGLGGLKALEKVVSLEDLMLIVASYEASDFRFPDMAAFGNPALSNHNMPMPKQAGGVTPGVNLYAKWKINNKNKQQKLLQELLGLEPELGVTLQVGKQPQKNSRLFVSYDTKIDGKWPLRCQFGFAMNNGTPELFLAGNTQIKIQKQPFNFDVAMSFVKSGAFLSGTMRGTAKFEGVQLSNMALAVGINWGGIPSLGVAASINTRAFSSSIAVFFDSTDPTRSVLAGSVSDLSLRDIATTIASTHRLPNELGSVLRKFKIQGTRSFMMPAGVGTALDDRDIGAVAKAFRQHGKVGIPAQLNRVLLVVNQKGKVWHLTDMQNEMRNYQIRKDPKSGRIRVSLDAQLYCAPQYSQIGTLAFQQGFFINGTLSILGLQSTTTVEVSKNKGIAFESYLNKALVIGNDNLFKLSNVKGKKGPRISVSTFSQPNQPDKLFRKPHFYMDGKLRLLGLQNTCLVQITQSGCIFMFQQKAQARFSIPAFSGRTLLQFDFNGKINTRQGADIAAAVKMRLQGKISPGKIVKMPKHTPLSEINKLGSIKLSEELDGKVRVRVNGKRITVNFTTRVKLEGLPTIRVNARLNARTANLVELGDVVAREIEKELKGILKDLTQWVKWVDKGIVQGVKGVEQVGEVVVNVFGKSPQATAKILKDAGKDVEDVGKVLNKVCKVNPKDAEKFLKQNFKISDKDLKKVLKGAGYAAKDVEKFFGNVGKGIGKTATSVAKKVKFW